MPSKEPVKVLRAFAPFLNFMRSYKLANFRTNRKDSIRGICVFLGVVALFSVFVATCVSMLWFCVLQRIRLIEIAQPMSIFLVCVQQSLIYVSIAIGNRQINAVIQCLQRLVEGSKQISI